MTLMRKAVMATILVGSLSAVATFSSCNKDETPAPTTNTPTTKDSDKFVGTWGAAEQYENGGSFDYQMSITAGTDNNVTISTVTGATDFLNIKAIVSGTTITIPQQVVAGADYQHIEGSGTLETTSNKINVKYKLRNDNGNTLDVIGVWTKK